jgi:hypothetical protein
MAIRTDFTAGEVLAAADLNDTFASKPPFAYGTATPTTTVEGFIFYDENVTPPAPKFWDGSAFQSFGGGKILQVVRATDATNRTTTSTTYVDVTGMSVTITPQKSTSAILLLLAAQFVTENNTNDELRGYAQITDSSNNTISGAEELAVGPVGFAGNTLNVMSGSLVIFAYATPATTSAVTYKVRFKGISPNSVQFKNATSTGQLYAIEVSA